MSKERVCEMILPLLYKISTKKFFSTDELQHAKAFNSKSNDRNFGPCFFGFCFGFLPRRCVAVDIGKREFICSAILKTRVHFLICLI